MSKVKKGDTKAVMFYVTDTQEGKQNHHHQLLMEGVPVQYFKVVGHEHESDPWDSQPYNYLVHASRMYKPGDIAVLKCVYSGGSRLQDTIEIIIWEEADGTIQTT